ncbi:hypothetical protein QQS21_012707 [Conoideocrella luteorostrata]|uniref:Phosphoglycerate mutase-like protein n=1 Tax=Conoideocrella luteorostrata TaxID=1105319 RepID=A0AAJ0CAN6_9HYPO|nr:hypothetical protein QQS21_012707 [Conoideocrella luteorostrata]
MAKPRLIIIIRHAQSEGNKNREIHQSVPDHRVKLTPDGWSQAHDAGRRLRNLLRPDDTLQIFTSPYRRTRETTEGILATLTADEPEPSPFRRDNIKVYEEPRLREQDFGNFQPCSAEMERMWQERADYGHFFYRIPNGESAADAYDRVSGFNESLWRQFGDDDFPSVCVLVTHGLMSRVFLMKWYHFTVEYFEDLRNVDHCEFLLMRKQETEKFVLETKLRTWSELRRERALANKDKDVPEKDESKIERNRAFVVTRRWGGCPNGCNHTNHYKKRHDLEALRQKDNERSGYDSNGITTIASRRHRHKSMASVGDGDDEHELDGDHRQRQQQAVVPAIQESKLDHKLDEVLSSPDSTPSFITAEDRVRSVKSPHLHVGRDFGGTYSGHTSAAGSDSDASFDERANHPRVNITHGNRVRAVEEADLSDRSTRNRVARYANRLGDAPHGGGSDMEDLAKAEEEDRSLRGSVY